MEEHFAERGLCVGYNSGAVNANGQCLKLRLIVDFDTSVAIAQQAFESGEMGLRVEISHGNMKNGYAGNYTLL